MGFVSQVFDIGSFGKALCFFDQIYAVTIFLLSK